MREFSDAAGVAWKVFRATPHSSPARRENVLPEAFRDGWLVFECDAERRRLAPFPDDWEELADEQLERLCVAYHVVPERSRGRRTADAAPKRVEEVQAVLAQVLDEVCDMRPAPSLDTGELIRVEQTLAIAADAAREAVALRRAMHGDSR